MCYAQLSFSLVEELHEISGLEVIDNNTYAAINDSGNEPTVYFLSSDGNITKRIKITNAKNVDWEDLARDDDFLYVGDFGNNLNKRKNLCIYKIRIKDLKELKEVEAAIIEFSYEDQLEFPPNKSTRNYDAEGMTVVNDSIFIFSKNSSDPWTGVSKMYGLSTKPQKQVAKIRNEVYIGPDNWWEDAITSADYYNGFWYLLTYNRIIQLIPSNNSFFTRTIYEFETTTQTESIKFLNSNQILIADEKQRLIGGGKLYKYNIKL